MTVRAVTALAAAVTAALVVPVAVSSRPEPWSPSPAIKTRLSLTSSTRWTYACPHEGTVGAGSSTFAFHTGRVVKILWSYPHFLAVASNGVRSSLDVQGHLSDGRTYACDGAGAAIRLGCHHYRDYLVGVLAEYQRGRIVVTPSGGYWGNREGGTACPSLGMTAYPSTGAPGLRYYTGSDDPNTPANTSINDWLSGGAITSSARFVLRQVQKRGRVVVHGAGSLHIDPTHGPARAPGLVADTTVKWTLTVTKCPGKYDIHGQPICP